MPCIETRNRQQTTLLPNKLDNYITKENPTRIINAFVTLQRTFLQTVFIMLNLFMEVS